LDVASIIKRGNELAITNRERRAYSVGLQSRILQKEAEVKGKADTLDTYIRAATIIGNVSDENTRATLDRVTGVINRALDVIFREESRSISIKQVMYKNVHPHFVVELTSGGNQVRTFKQSGTGLAQIISFLFTACLVDARKGRKILIMDELLNGLHPYAKQLVRDLLVVLSKRFQFVIVEYGVDVGKQYLVKLKGNTSSVLNYNNNSYYKDIEEDKFKEKPKY